MAKMTQKVPKMTKNGPNNASNTNTKLPDLKWQKIAKKLPKNGQNDPKMAKNDQKWPKMAQIMAIFFI